MLTDLPTILPTPNSLFRTTEDLARNLSGNATLWIRAAGLIYDVVTAPRPLKNEDNEFYRDFSRHNTLCELRRAVNHAKVFPKEWELDEKRRPKCKVNFHDNATEILKHAEGVSASDYPQKNLVAGMAERISDLLIALNKRGWRVPSWRNYRSDGFEMMFFSDLAMWLCIDLPRYDVKKEETLEQVAAWITYCETVQDKVLFYREQDLISFGSSTTGDVSINHVPKDTLDEIIRELGVLHQNISKACKAATFNDKIQRVNAIFLDISKHMFTFFYLLLNEVDSKHFLVDVFLRHDDLFEEEEDDGSRRYAIYKKKIKLANYTMGKWINATLMKAGIHSNDFENETDLKFAEISHHLRIDVNQMNLRDAGLWRFAATRVPRATSARYLQQINDLHRLLLKHCYMRRSLILSAEVSNRFGRAWVYGEDGGKETIDCLLQILTLSSNELLHTLEAFWKDFFKQGYKRLHPRTDNTSECFRRLDQANDVLKAIKECIQVRMQKEIRGIRAEIQEAPQHKELAQKEARQLQRNLQECAHFFGLTVNFPDEEPTAEPFEIPFEDLGAEECKASEPPAQSRSVDDECSDPPEDGVMNHSYEASSLTFFNLASHLLQNTEIKDRTLISWMDRTLLRNTPQHFHSTLQANIYKDYLVFNQAFVDMSNFKAYCYSFFYQIYPFIDLYSRVNAVMKLLYLEHQCQPKPVEIALIDMLLQETINASFNQHRYYTYQVQWQQDEPSLTITERDDNKVEVQWDMFKVAFTREAYASSQLVQILKRREAAIEELQARNTALTEDLALKDEQLADKDNLISAQSTRLVSQSRQIAEQSKELTQTRAINAAYDQELAQTRAMNAAYDQELAQTRAMNAAYDQELAELRAQFRALQECVAQKKAATSDTARHRFHPPAPSAAASESKDSGSDCKQQSSL